MRFLILGAVVAVAVSGCAGQQTAQLGQLPVISQDSAPEASGTQSIAARTLAAIAIERVTRRPTPKLDLLGNPQQLKKQSF